VNPLDFLPEVWTSDELPPMLVSGRCWMNGQPVTGAATASTFAWISHAVAILMTTPPAVCLGFKTGDADTEWTRHPPEDLGIPTRAANLALTEAMRCVTVSHDVITGTAEGKTNGKKMVDFRGKDTIHRDITVWLAWGHWESRKATFEERRKDIQAQGFALSPDGFRRLLEDAGMSI
jgi:hypothetical protein